MRIDVEDVADDGRGQRVRHVVPPRDPELARREQDDVTVAPDEHELLPIVQVRAMTRTQGEREAADLGRRAGVERHRRGIVEVQHRDVARPLPGDDVPLRGDVGVTGPVMVEVILENIGDDGDVRAVSERLELEAR